MTIALRLYQSSDCAALADLMTTLGYPTTPDEMAQRMSRLESSSYRTIVATSENTVVGMIGLVRNFLWEQNGCYVRIQALVVQASARRQGIGRRLMEAAERWAAELDAVFVALNCGERSEREAAHHFYKRLGFQRKSIGYIKRLSVQ